jgi:hypothetical protein
VRRASPVCHPPGRLPDGSEVVVEILGAGRSFLAFTPGAPWYDATPLCGRNALPATAAAQVALLLTQVGAELRDRGAVLEPGPDAPRDAKEAAGAPEVVEAGPRPPGDTTGDAEPDADVLDAEADAVAPQPEPATGPDLAVTIEITVLTKSDGPLTKRIGLAPDGSLHSDGSACLMADGSARRARFDSLHAFADFITRMRSCDALALGALRPDLPDTVHVVTKRQRSKLNGADDAVITRTHDHIGYRPQLPALVLIDVDTKGMPTRVAERIEALGGVLAALAHVMPELANTGRVDRCSTSAGILRSDTGVRLPGSDGHHVYLMVADGADTERFLRTLHDRCWLRDLGWLMVGVAGQLLNRSLVDRMVFAPERLVFEGAPILLPPLLQDIEVRRAVATAGPALDTSTACPPLRIVEQSRLAELRAREEHRLAPERTLAHEAFITTQTERIVQRTGVSHARARHTAERLSAGVLLSQVVLEWDDANLAGCSVADVLADPERFVGATLADPLEGVAYGICKARIMQRPDGTLWIHSFAHGRTVYELRHDADAASARLDGVPIDQLVTAFIRIVLTSDLTAAEYETRRNTVAKRTGIARRTIEQSVKQARLQLQQQQETEWRRRAAAIRRDRRPRIHRPPPDEPWLPQMLIINDVLTVAPRLDQPRRDIDDEIARRRLLSLPRMHLLTSETADPDDTPTAGSAKT